eukprot:5000686-Ditylum_brightwellii.AAC.1
MLGHYKAPVDTGATQIQVLKEKAEKYALQIMTSPLSTSKAHLFYQIIFQESLGYVLGQSCIKAHQLCKIEQKAQHAFATKCSFNQNMKYEIRDGLEELGRVDFFSLVYVQGITQITIFLKHWRTDSITSNLLHIALVWCQYQVGTANPILENVQQKLHHLEA